MCDSVGQEEGGGGRGDEFNTICRQLLKSIIPKFLSTKRYQLNDAAVCKNDCPILLHYVLGSWGGRGGGEGDTHFLFNGSLSPIL